MNIGKYIQLYSEDLRLKNYAKSSIENSFCGIPHESYLGTCGFIVNKADETISKILIQFEQVPKTAKVYTVVQHYPYQKLQVKFPATEISHIVSKLLKYKFL